MSKTKTYMDKLNELKAQAINQYMKRIGSDCEEKRQELESMSSNHLFSMIDEELRKMRAKELPHCGTCKHLYPMERAEWWGGKGNPFIQRCSNFVNVKWKDKDRKRQKEFVRRPSNKACPNYEKGDNDFLRARREKGKD